MALQEGMVRGKANVLPCHHTALQVHKCCALYTVQKQTWPTCTVLVHKLSVVLSPAVKLMRLVVCLRSVVQCVPEFLGPCSNV